MTPRIAEQPHTDETAELRSQGEAEAGRGFAEDSPDLAFAHAVNVARALDRVHVIIPALNEERGIARVLKELGRIGVQNIIVVDNGSTDGTADVAGRFGAVVVKEPRRGYGSACLAGIKAHADAAEDAIFVFVDADGSDDATQLPALLGPILRDDAD